MIVTDIFGNRVNAEIFKLEVIEGAEGDERGKPVLILSGYHYYEDRLYDIKMSEGEELQP